MTSDLGFDHRYLSAQDGLRLHYREYGSTLRDALPIICLPGLARTASDFHRLAESLADGGRRVLALDYRGRGLSARDPDPANYDLKVESSDVLTLLTAAEVSSAIFIGTSRGGLITMILAALRPSLIAGTVLNDIGPVIEVGGLRRIKGYVGKLPRPKSWDDAVAILKSVAGTQFTALSENDWMDFAQSTFLRDGDSFSMNYDPALMRNLETMDLDGLPTLWPQFEALGHAPVLIVRGQNTDLLSTETVEEMQRRHRDCAVHTVPGQGHAPLLTDALTIGTIADFVRHCDPPTIA